MRVLLVGGLEPTGRVGVLADYEVARAHADAVVVATALTSLADTVPFTPTPTARLSVVGPVDGVKAGMLPTAAWVRALAAFVREARPRVTVLDTPRVSATGAPLTSEDTRSALLALLPLVTVVTPNLDEAAWLTGTSVATVEEMRAAARALVAAGAGAAVVKGGHLAGAPTDVLFDGDAFGEVLGARVAADARGTGCRYATALLVCLLAGEALPRAAEAAAEAVRTYLEGGR